MQKQQTIPQLMVLAVFGGDCRGLNVDAAVRELKQAGFEVLRMPESLRPLLAHAKDDFVEAPNGAPLRSGSHAREALFRCRNKRESFGRKINRRALESQQPDARAAGSPSTAPWANIIRLMLRSD